MNASTPDLQTENVSAAARRTASPWVQHLARFGYAAKGVVYLLVGGIALGGALEAGGRTTGSKGALATVVQQPWGRWLLGLIAFGLAGYAIWKITQAALDPEDEGTDAKGLAKRIYFVVSGVIHGGLVVFAISLITGSGSGGGGDSTEQRASWLMSKPGGIFLVGAIGLAILAAAGGQFYRAWKADFSRLDLNRLSSTARDWVIRIGRFGLSARGVVLGIIGVFFVLAAYWGQADQVGGLGEALRTLERQGVWLFALVALGLMAYGAFQLVKSRLRVIRV